MTDKIDDLLADQSAPLYETALLEFAAEHDPDLLARFANGLYARVDQDGAFRDIETAHRRRTLTLHRRADGQRTIAGELTCEAGRIPRDHSSTPSANRTPAPTANATRAPPDNAATTRCSKH